MVITKYYARHNMCIFDLFNEAVSINIYRDGEKTEYTKESGKFIDVLTVWKDMCANARNMPAYGVSLNDETLKALKQGLWLEFCFEELITCNDLPFEKLLVEVNSEWTGFNLIRYESGRGYSGRCFYFNLVNRDMSALHNILTSEL